MELISTNHSSISNGLACAAFLMAGGLLAEHVRTDLNLNSQLPATNVPWPTISSATAPAIFLTDIDSEVYRLVKPARLTITQSAEDGYVIMFPEADISVAGETADEALLWMKSSIVTVFETLVSESALGPLPALQLAALESHLGKKSASKA